MKTHDLPANVAGLAWLVCVVPGIAAAALIPGAAGGRADWLATVQAQAVRRGVPPALADAVAMVETGYRADAVGSSGEIGMMQLLPATARQLGFAGPLAGLFEPATNIALGVAYLGRAWALSGGDVCRTLMKYRAGLGEEVMTLLSARYCVRALAWLGGAGSTLGLGTQTPEKAAADPHVIAVVPALAARRLLPMLASDRPPRTMAQREALLQARFDSHMRRTRTLDRVDAAIAAALAEPQD